MLAELSLLMIFLASTLNLSIASWDKFLRCWFINSTCSCLLSIPSIGYDALTACLIWYLRCWNSKELSSPLLWFYELECLWLNLFSSCMLLHIISSLTKELSVDSLFLEVRLKFKNSSVLPKLPPAKWWLSCLLCTAYSIRFGCMC